MMNVQLAILVLTISLDDLSKDSSTIISSKDEFLHEFIDIDSVHDVFVYVTQCSIIKTLLTAGYMHIILKATQTAETPFSGSRGCRINQQ